MKKKLESDLFFYMYSVCCSVHLFNYIVNMFQDIFIASSIHASCMRAHKYMSICYVCINNYMKLNSEKLNKSA